MLTWIRHRMGRFAWLVMALMAMTSAFVAPAVCGSASALAAQPSMASATARGGARLMAAAPGEMAGCHMAATAGDGQCPMGGSCCASMAGASTPGATSPVQPFCQPSSCLRNASQSDALLSAPAVYTLDVTPAAQPALLAEDPAPPVFTFSTDPQLLPPRDFVARPWGSRGPPAFLA